MIVGRFFGKTGRGLAIAAAILAAIGLTTVPRPAYAGGGWVEVGSALVPASGSGSELSPSAPCSQTRTIIRITTHTATTATIHPPRLTIHKRRIIRPREAVGAPIIITIMLVE